MKDMTENGRLPFYKRQFICSFLWVWGVCFLFIYGFLPIVIIVELDVKISLPTLVFLSVILSLPVGLFMTRMLFIYKQRRKEYRNQQGAVRHKGANIAIVIIMLCLLMTIIGLHINMYTPLRFGRYWAFLGIIVGSLMIAIFWFLKLIKYLGKEKKKK